MSIYTTESFIARCKEIHIDSGISYEKTVFTTTRQKITLTCKQHGGSKYIANIEFEHKDIERHPVVKDVLEIFQSLGK